MLFELLETHANFRVTNADRGDLLCWIGGDFEFGDGVGFGIGFGFVRLWNYRNLDRSWFRVKWFG